MDRATQDHPRPGAKGKVLFTVVEVPPTHPQLKHSDTHSKARLRRAVTAAARAAAWLGRQVGILVALLIPAVVLAVLLVVLVINPTSYGTWLAVIPAVTAGFKVSAGLLEALGRADLAVTAERFGRPVATEDV